MGRLLPKLFLTGSYKRIKFRLPPRLTFHLFSFGPALLFKTVQGWVERPLLHLQYLTRNLLYPLGNGPSMFGFERERIEDEQIKSSLHQIAWFPHTMIIYTQYCR
jgi:hypothetical protein